jgi:protein-S-isoprenylcysteine O-methyltransferase Ste14
VEVAGILNEIEASQAGGLDGLRQGRNVMTSNKTSNKAFSEEGTGPDSGKLVTERWQNKEGGARVHFPPPLVFLIFILLGVALQRTVRPLTIAVDRPLRVTGGIVLIAVALCLFIPALVLFRRTGQHPRPWAPTPELIPNGPYRFSRNPMYVAMTLVSFGLGIALNDLWVSLFALVSLLVVHFIAVLPEEQYLIGKFGESYRGYTARVRRYL